MQAKETKAYLKHLRIAPRKTRLLADLVRGVSLKEAKMLLSHESKRAALPVLKLLKSAENNAKHDHKMKEDDLYVKEIRVDSGRVLKRHMPRAHGRASAIRKRTSHILVTLSEKTNKK